MVFRSHEEDIHQKRNRVHNEREDKDILETARFRYDKVCDLVTRQARNRPSGERNAVQGGDIAHTVYVGKEGGKVAKSTAVTKVYDNKECDTNNDKFARNRAREKSQSGDNEFAN